jgi:hypothetical protein
MDESSEVSAFAILLLYSDWGHEGESSLGQNAAVTQLQSVKHRLPPYVLRSLKRIQRSEAILADAGEPEVVQDMDNNAEYVLGFHDEYDSQHDTAGLSAVSAFTYTDRVTLRAEVNQWAFLHAYVRSVKDALTASRDSATTMTAEERALKDADSATFIPVSGADARQSQLDAEVQQLNTEQRRAYLRAVEHIAGQTGQQMVMFLSGEGGTGKSKVIGAICTFAQIFHGKTVGTWGAVLKTAPTGGAAHNIGGSTYHSALSKVTNNGKAQHEITEGTVVSLQRKALGTALFVLDELSLLSCEDLADISDRLGLATGQTSVAFGGLHTLLVGDFYQMRPVGNTALVDTKIATNKTNGLRGRAIFRDSLTDFCMLTTNIRARASTGSLSPLANFCGRVRLGDVSGAILMTMNDRVVNTISVAMRHASASALWITSTHNKVAAINDAFKTRRLTDNEQMFTIIARHVPHQTGTRRLTAEVRRKLYAERGDRKGKRDTLMVSHMDLFIGSRVRLTRNLFVEGGLYNGAMGTVWGFVFRGDGVLPRDMSGGQRLFGDMNDKEREIPVVLVQMDGDDQSFTYSCSTSVPRLVPITEIQSACLVCGEYVRFQLPILPAEARTGHSVQGYTAHGGVVVEPGSTFFAGDYIAISRAKSKENVILLAPLEEVNFANPSHDGYRDMIKKEYDRLEAAFPQV